MFKFYFIALSISVPSLLNAESRSCEGIMTSSIQEIGAFKSELVFEKVQSLNKAKFELYNKSKGTAWLGIGGLDTNKVILVQSSSSREINTSWKGEWVESKGAITIFGEIFIADNSEGNFEGVFTCEPINEERTEFPEPGHRAEPRELEPIELEPVEQQQLVLKISRISKEGGKICYAVFDSPEGFGIEQSKDYLFADCVSPPECLESCSNYALEIPIKGLSKGNNYAISVFHDKNGNGLLDRISFGIPKEGVGFSKNPNILEYAGVPPFHASKFEFSDRLQTIDISLIYFL